MSNQESKAKFPCSREHSYFVAEVVGIQAEGKVHLVYLCTGCGDAVCKTFSVASPGMDMRMLREEKRINTTTK